MMPDIDPIMARMGLHKISRPVINENIDVLVNSRNRNKRKRIKAINPNRNPAVAAGAIQVSSTLRLAFNFTNGASTISISR